MMFSCRNMCRQRSFCASGCPAILLMNASRPFRRSSMKFSSKSPSSPRKGICRFQALPGRGGTTIYKGNISYLVGVFASCECLSLPCCPVPAHFLATRNHCSDVAHSTPLPWTPANWSVKREIQIVRFKDKSKLNRGNQLNLMGKSSWFNYCFIHELKYLLCSSWVHI